MRFHPSPVVTIIVALMFVSGTVGCQHTGGPWYNPKSYSPYAFTNPFAKDKPSDAPPFSSGAQAKTEKPSLDAKPNIQRPEGGYTNEPSFQANRSTSQSGVPSAFIDGRTNPTSADPGGYPSPVAANPYGDYTVAEPSPYPSYAGGQPSVAAAAPQQWQYQAEMPQSIPGNPMPYGHGDYHSAAGPYQQVNAVQPAAMPNYGAVDNFGGANHAMHGNNYAPFAASPPQNDPFAGGFQQPVPYTHEGIPGASPYQPYQQPYQQPQPQPYQPQGAFSY